MPTDGYITVSVRAHKDEETGQYVARCDDLGVSSAGDTLDEAFANLKEALFLYLNTLEEVGERERVFAECGIEVQAVEDDTVARQLSVKPHEHVSVQHYQVPAYA